MTPKPNIAEDIKELLINQAGLLQWYQDKKPHELEKIKTVKINLVRIKRIIQFNQQLAQLPIDTEFLAYRKEDIAGIHLIAPNYEIGIKDQAIWEALQEFNFDAKAMLAPKGPDYSAGSDYYKGCNEKFNAWLNKTPQKEQSIFYENECLKAKRKIWWTILPFFLKDKKFQENGNNIIIISELIKYYLGDPTCKLDLEKDIYLFGPEQVGKSLMLRCFEKLLTAIEDYKSFELTSAIHGYEQIKSREKQVMDFCKRDLAIDNLGMEPKLAFNKVEVPIYEHIIDIRHNIAIKRPLRTHVTSKIRPDRLNQVYSQDIQNLASQRWNFVFLDGNSLT